MSEPADNRLVVYKLEVHTQARSERIGRTKKLSVDKSNLNFDRAGGGRSQQ